MQLCQMRRMLSVTAPAMFSLGGTSLIAFAVSTYCVLTDSLAIILFCKFFVSPHLSPTRVEWHCRHLLFNSMHTKPIGAAEVSQTHL